MMSRVKQNKMIHPINVYDNHMLWTNDVTCKTKQDESPNQCL